MKLKSPGAPYLDRFESKNFEKLRAPVAPPLWVMELLQMTRRPVYWENTHGARGVFDLGGYNPMIYRTEFEGQEIVTRLCPGSTTPVDGWLY